MGLKEKLQQRAQRRAELFRAYACHNDNNRLARRILDGGPWGNWHKPERGEPVYYAERWPNGWRDLGDAHEVCRREGRPRLIEHTGWYCDQWQDGVIRGRVLQLPARNGSPVYVAGTYCTDWDGVTLHLSSRFDDACDAALYADECARVAAEQSREHHARDAAEQEAGRLREDIKTTRRAALALLREIRTVYPGRKTTPGAEHSHICAALRARIENMLASIQADRARIAALADNFWLAVGEG